MTHRVKLSESGGKVTDRRPSTMTKPVVADMRVASGLLDPQLYTGWLKSEEMWVKHCKEVCENKVVQNSK